MRLADFIEHEREAILSRWEEFAGTLLPASRGLDSLALRDHADQMLRAICADLRSAQTREEQELKSRGGAPAALPATAAQTHAVLRATGGFTIRQLVGEYRALRASVLRQYLDSEVEAAGLLEDVGRFNEAIDQAIAESVDTFASEVDRWRNIFLGVLGHDLRGPLNAIQLTAALLSQNSPDAEHTALVDRLQKSGLRMSELLDDLLDFNRVSVGGHLDIDARDADVVECCRHEVELQRASHPAAHIELTVDDAYPGLWDTSRIRQALGNLITNAVTYGNGGPVHVIVQSDGDQLVLAVENEGAQLTTLDKQTIFNPLVRGSSTANDRERAHLGLGLFIVRQTAEGHGGRVDAESIDGRTRFSMVLPRSGSANAPQ